MRKNPQIPKRNFSKRSVNRISNGVKMKIKKGDTVVVTSGKDKGKQGEVLRVLPREGRIIIDGIALAKHHTKKRGGQSGRIVERPAPVHASNVMVVDPESKKPTRVGRRMQNGRLVRFARKSGTKLL